MIKLPLIPAILMLTLSAPVALAQQSEDEHAAHHPEQGGGQQSGQGVPGAQAMDSKPRQLMQNMKQIQDLMRQIHETKDPTR